MVEINSWKFTQLIIHTINMKRKWLQEKEFLLSSPTNEWKNFHFWDSHFHINWFIRRHLFAISSAFSQLISFVFFLLSFFSVMTWEREKWKLKKQKNEEKEELWDDKLNHFLFSIILCIHAWMKSFSSSL